MAKKILVSDWGDVYSLTPKQYNEALNRVANDEPVEFDKQHDVVFKGNIQRDFTEFTAEEAQIELEYLKEG